jgi:hypothetical protein
MSGAAASRIRVRAQVLRYDASAATDDYADGTHQRFGATALEILAPERLRRRALTIYHDGPVDVDSPWRLVGRVLSFVLDGDLIADGTQVFAGAIRDLGVEGASP